jgi:L-threonylcarbamoyladenylate synthase
LPLVAADLAQVAAVALPLDAAARALADAFWPGPLTLVVPKSPGCPVSELATAGLDTIAVRTPEHPIARKILEAFGRPIVAPSANRSGHVSPTTAAHVIADLGGSIDLVIDGGSTQVGVESTIVSCVGEPPVLLRPGGVTRARIERELGIALASAPGRESTAPLAPGMLESHYAPRARLRLDADEVEPGEALLAFGPTLVRGADQAIAFRNLSPAGDLIEAAAKLFSDLRALDVVGPASIAAMPIPHEGLGEAINDRLARAAAPKQSS